MKSAPKNIATGATSHEYPNLIPTARKIKMYPAATSDAGVRIIRKARFMPHLPIPKVGPSHELCHHERSEGSRLKKLQQLLAHG